MLEFSQATIINKLGFTESDVGSVTTIETIRKLIFIDIVNGVATRGAEGAAAPQKNVKKN